MYKNCVLTDKELIGLLQNLLFALVTASHERRHLSFSFWICFKSTGNGECKKIVKEKPIMGKHRTEVFELATLFRVI